MPTGSASADHPAWCSRSDCLALKDGYIHHSRLMSVAVDAIGLTVSVQLMQYPSVPGYPKSGRPMVALTTRPTASDDPTEPYLLPLDCALARVVARMLLKAVDEAVQGDQPVDGEVYDHRSSGSRAA